MNQGEVYFTLFRSDFDPSIALSEIPIDWAITKLKADPIPKQSSWRCSTGRQRAEYIDVYEMASTLVSRLTPYAEEIILLKGRLSLKSRLSVVLYISANENVTMPAIGFEADVLEFLHKVGATIDVDTYLVTD